MKVKEEIEKVGLKLNIQKTKIMASGRIAAAAAAAAKSRQSCLTLSDPIDCSLPGSSVHGIFQARVLEWGAIAFSDSTDSTYLFWAFIEVPARSVLMN